MPIRWFGLLRYLGVEPSERDQDGSAVFEVVVRNQDAFRHTVLEFLEHAEILDPPNCAPT